MTFDQLQKTWQSQQTGFQFTIDSSMLLKEVKRNKEHFEWVIFSRDVREVAITFVVSIALLIWGLKVDLWPLLLMALLALGVGLFFVVDRTIQKRRRPRFSESLTGCIESSLAQVTHQIWLLKNVLWWYLLPPGVGTAILLGYVAWQLRNWAGGLIFVFVSLVFCGLVLWGIYRLNQLAVRKHLAPRKAELEQLLSALKESA